MFYPRALAARLGDSLADTPVVLLAGPRQAGKSTLAKQAVASLGTHIRAEAEPPPLPQTYFTLDDSNVLAAVRADAQGFLESVRSQPRVVIDEVQRAPDLLVALKREVDLDRRPGRYVLTGSTNLLSMPAIAESLAGRIEPLTLWPLAQCEFEGNEPAFLRRLFGEDLQVNSHEPRESIIARALRGGYPEAASRTDLRRRSAWFGAYVTTIVQREIKSISAIDDDTSILRILRAIATRSGGPRNIQTLSRDTGIPSSTIQRHMALLQATFLVAEIPAWYRNLDARLVKSPKMLITDSGLYANLLNLTGADNHTGFLLETFAGAELLRLISFEPSHQYALLHFRTQKQYEVDFVVERADRRIAGIEVKMARSVSQEDFGGLRALKAAAGESFAAGVVLYLGERTLPFGDRLAAVPVTALWQ